MKTQSKLQRAVVKGYWTLVTAGTWLLYTVQPAFAADDIWTKFSNLMKDLYGKILGVSTIVAVTVAAVALVIRMVSRNQRAVDEATSWVKRIVITWVILNTLGFIVAYIQPLVAGGQYKA
jgi:putative copper export protein